MKLFCIDGGTLAIYGSPHKTESETFVVGLWDGTLVLFCDLPYHLLVQVQALSSGPKAVSLTTGSVFYESVVNGCAEIRAVGIEQLVPSGSVVVGIAGEAEGVQYAICSAGLRTARAAVAAIMFVETGNIMARRIAQQREQREVA